MSDEEKSLEELEEELKQLENNDSSGSYGFPTKEKKDSTLRLFRDLIEKQDSKKFGNLNSTELGSLEVGVRGLLNIALYAEAEGLNKAPNDVASYFRNKAEIISSTSMSRGGWFGNLIVTQIKKEQKVKEPVQVKKTLWGGTKVVQPQGGE